MANYTDPIGAVLIYGDEILSKMKQLDKTLLDAEKYSNTFAQNMYNALNVTGTADSLRKSLDYLKKQLTSLGKIRSASTLGQAFQKSTDSMTKLATNAERAREEINKTVETTSRAAEQGVKFNKVLFDENSIAMIEKRMEKLRKAIERGKALNSKGTLQGSVAGSLDATLQQQYVNELEYLKRRKQMLMMSEQEKADILARGAQQALDMTRRYNSQIYNTEVSLMNKRLQLTNKIAELKSKPKLGDAETQLLKAYEDELLRVEKQLDRLAKKYPRLSKEAQNAFRVTQLESQVRNAERLDNQLDKLRNSQRGLIDIGSQLKGVMSSVFSVYQIGHFLRRMVEVRGEFELQHRALQAIIQDVDKADKLWSQITELAVKSPFRVKELVTYTKQLAAYRIEYDKIFDVTKRLADVSAGLGVDMNRLILAYGQVKAANYLRGQELRQFSEAGINILGELADKFTEVSGRAISTGEVFDMVSKRMVKFEDVAEVFERLTNEGGIFYEMQEKQAETLKGRISNLKDSLDLMYDSIGKANNGLLKWGVTAFKNLVDNWRKWTPIILASITAIIVRWAAFTLAVKLSGKTFKQVFLGLTQNIQFFIRSLVKGKVAAQEFAAANNLAANTATGWAALATIVLSVTMYIVQAARAAGALKREIKGIQKEADISAAKLQLTYRTLADTVRDTNKSYKEQQDALEKLKSTFGDILPDRLLDIEYLQSESYAYKEATQAIIEHANAKAREKAVEALIEGSQKRDEKTLGYATSSMSKYFTQNSSHLVNERDLENILAEVKSMILTERITNEDTAKKYIVDFLVKRFGLSEGTAAAGTSNRYYNKLINDWLGDVAKLNKLLKDTDTTFYDISVDAERAIKGVDDSMKEMDNTISNFIGKTGEDSAAAEKAIIDYINVFKTLGGEDSEISKFFKGVVKDGEDMHAALMRIFSSNALKEEFMKYSRQGFLQLIGDQYGGKGVAGENVEKTIKRLMSKDAYDTRQKEEIEWMKEYAGSNIEMYNELYKYLIQSGEGVKEANEKLKGVIDEIKLRIQAFEDPEKFGYISFFGNQEEYDAAKTILPALEALFKKRMVGNPTTSNRTDNIVSKRIKLIQDMNKEYDKLRQNFTHEASVEKVLKSYADAWKEIMGGTGISISDFFTSKQGTADELALLRATAGKYAKELEKAIGDTKVEIDVDLKKDTREKLKNQLDNMFDGYSLWKELEKAGVTPSIAKDLFQIDATSLEEIRKFVDQNEEQLTGTLGEELVRQTRDKLNEMEQQQRTDDLKEYVKYLHEAMNERVKVQYETLQKIQRINKMAGVDDQTKSLMIEGVRKDERQKLNKLDWEDLKNSDLYVKLFEDLDKQSTATLRAIKNRLNEVKVGMGEDPINVKAITEQIEKLDRELKDRNPFSSLLASIKEIKGLRSEDSLLKDLIEGKGEEEKLQKYEDILQLAVEAQGKSGDVSALDQGLLDAARTFAENIDPEKLAGASWEKLLAAIKKVNKEQKDANEQTEKDIKTWEDFKASVKASLDAIKDYVSNMKTLSDSAFELAEAMGGMETESSKAFKDLAGDILEAVPAIAALVAAFDSLTIAEGAANAAAGWIGLIAVAVSALIKVTTSIIKYTDSIKEDRIKKMEKEVDSLAESYDRLSKAFDQAYDAAELTTTMNAMNASLEERIELYDRMIAQEEAKKDTDKDRIDDWKKTQRELVEQIEENHENFLEAFGGVGASDFASQAEAFADAWLSAFNETGDGLDAIREKWDDIVNNLIKKQLVSRGLKVYLEGALNYLNTALDDGLMTSAEFETLKNLTDDASVKMNEYMKGLAQTIGFTGTGDVKLSGLQEGIQGMSEQTAEILAAYANSLRLLASERNTTLQSLAASILSNESAENPILSELRVQTEQIRQIRQGIDSIIEKGAAGGRAIRVVS